MERRDPLFTLSSLYKKLVWVSWRKMQLFIHPKFNKASDPCRAALFLGAIWEKNQTAFCVKESCATKHISYSLNAMCVNFISERSRVDGDMILHVIIFGCLRAAELKSKSGLSPQIKEKQWGVVSTEAQVLVADKVTTLWCPQELPLSASFPYTRTLSHALTHTHSMFLLISEEREAPLHPHNRSAFPSSLSPHSHLFGRWNQSSSHR